MIDIVSSPELPPTVGPFSPGVRAHGLLFLSGQVAIDPETQKLVAGGVAAETERALQNLRLLLQAAGKDFKDVVSVRVFLKSMTEFTAMNGAYAKHFSAPFPARTTVAVADLPLGASVEIDLIAA